MIQVTGGAPGIAFVGWLSDSDNRGYAEYLRAFSIKKGWLSQPLRVSTGFGASSVWPGDTFGISSLSANELALSWGSAIPSLGKKFGDIRRPRERASGLILELP